MVAWTGGVTRRPRSRAWSEEEARSVLADQAASGQSVLAFALSRGLTPQRLDWWRKRLPPERSGPARSRKAFIPVHVRLPATDETAASADAPVFVTLGAGLRVEVRELGDETARWVAALANAVGARRP